MHLGNYRWDSNLLVKIELANKKIMLHTITNEQVCHDFARFFNAVYQEDRFASNWELAYGAILLYRLQYDHPEISGVQIQLPRQTIEVRQEDAAVSLYVNATSGSFKKVKDRFAGTRQLSANRHPESHEWDTAFLDVLLDNGAFSVSQGTQENQSPAQALERQLVFEAKAAELWGVSDWHSNRLAVADCLFDAEQTIAGARYYDRVRSQLPHQTLVFTVQGTTAAEYVDCLQEILLLVRETDWIAIGGFRNLGLSKYRKQLYPLFQETMRRCLPLLRWHDVSHLHLWGISWEKPLAEALALCDIFGLTLSADSFTPLRVFNSKEPLTKGAKYPDWRDHYAWKKARLALLRQDKVYYRLTRVFPLDLWLSASQEKQAIAQTQKIANTLGVELILLWISCHPPDRGGFYGVYATLYDAVDGFTEEYLHLKNPLNPRSVEEIARINPQ